MAVSVAAVQSQRQWLLTFQVSNHCLLVLQRKMAHTRAMDTSPGTRSREVRFYSAAYSLFYAATLHPHSNESLSLAWKVIRHYWFDLSQTLRLLHEKNINSVFFLCFCCARSDAILRQQNKTYYLE